MTALDITFFVVGTLGILLPLAVGMFLIRVVREQERELKRAPAQPSRR